MRTPNPSDDAVRRQQQLNYETFLLGYNFVNELAAATDFATADETYELCLDLASLFHGSRWDDEERPIDECLAEFIDYVKGVYPKTEYCPDDRTDFERLRAYTDDMYYHGGWEG